jgi:hypothetical protein
MRRYSLLIGGVSLAIAGVVLLVTLPDVRIQSNPDDRFSGGAGDGFVNTIYFQNPPTAAIPPVRFSGAASDGYSYRSWSMNDLVYIQPSPRFSGNILDGFASAFLLQQPRNIELPSVRFGGGLADGFAEGAKLSYTGNGIHSGWRFYGGTSDGYTYTLRIGTTASGLLSIARFYGGSSDGYVYCVFTGASKVASLSVMRFWGGSMDGSAFSTFLPSGSLWCLFPPRFSGGSFDGFETSHVRVPISVIAVDSDHDGIPDWWVNRFYTNVASFSATNDADGDGANAASEYLAGTDPAKPDSAFKIGSIYQEGGSFVLSYPSTDFRIYTVQSLNNLAGGVWSNMPGHTRVPGGISGTMTTPIGITSNACMMRVLVEFP